MKCDSFPRPPKVPVADHLDCISMLLSAYLRDIYSIHIVCNFSSLRRCIDSDAGLRVTQDNHTFLEYSDVTNRVHRRVPKLANWGVYSRPFSVGHGISGQKWSGHGSNLNG